jgi:hypothetical protein
VDDRKDGEEKRGVIRGKGEGCLFGRIYGRELGTEIGGRRRSGGGWWRKYEEKGFKKWNGERVRV